MKMKMRIMNYKIELTLPEITGIERKVSFMDRNVQKNIRHMHSSSVTESELSMIHSYQLR